MVNFIKRRSVLFYSIIGIGILLIICCLFIFAQSKNNNELLQNHENNLSSIQVNNGNNNLGTEEHAEEVRQYLYSLYGEQVANRLIEELESEGYDLKDLNMNLDEIFSEVD